MCSPSPPLPRPGNQRVPSQCLELHFYPIISYLHPDLSSRRVRYKKTKGIFIKFTGLVFFYMSSILGTGRQCRGTQGARTQSCDPYPYDLAPCPSNKRIQVTEPERSWNLLGLFWAELPPRWSPARLAWACHEEEERYMVSSNGRAVSLIFQLGL